VEPRLQELNFGAWEGLAWDAIPREEIDAWAADPLGYRPRGGETVNELASRVEQAWRQATATARHELWITHAGPMRCLYALTMGQPLAQCLDRRFDYGEVLDLRAPT
jgi:alpha-ribazole phosphatase